MSEVQKIIATLNSLQVGDLSAIMRKLDDLSSSLRRLEFAAQSELVDQAAEALGRGRVPQFRKLVSRAVAELGHLK